MRDWLRMRSSRWVLCAIAVAALGGCSSGAGVPPGAQRNGGFLTLALVGPAGGIDPLTANNASAATLDALIYDGLVRVSPSQEPLPDLARSWSVSPNGLVWSFHLARARWQDGRAVTAQDVAFTYSAFMDPRNGSAAAIWFADVKQVSTQGERTLKVTLSRPDAALLLEVGSLPILPGHLLRQLKSGPQLLSSPFVGSRAVGTGPFALVFARQGRFTLRANRHYFLGRPHLDGVRLRTFSTPQAALLALRSGRVDLAPVPPADGAAVRTWPSVRIASSSAPDYRVVAWNFSDPLFESAELRRALVYAVDRSAIVRQTLDGFGVIAQGPVAPNSWAYDPAVPAVPYDPRQAARLLARAGWKRGRGPYLVNRAGAPLRFSILVNAESPSRVLAVRMVVQDLRALGVEATLREASFAEYTSDLVQGNFQAAMLERGIGPDPDPSAYYLSARHPVVGANFTAYGSYAVDEAILQERAAVDETARRIAFADIQQAMAQDPPGIFLTYPLSMEGLSRHFRGFVPDAYASEIFAPNLWTRQ